MLTVAPQESASDDMTEAREPQIGKLCTSAILGGSCRCSGRAYGVMNAAAGLEAQALRNTGIQQLHQDILMKPHMAPDTKCACS